MVWVTVERKGIKVTLDSKLREHRDMTNDHRQLKCMITQDRHDLL